jgi:hypothetical protein
MLVLDRHVSGSTLTADTARPSKKVLPGVEAGYGLDGKLDDDHGATG